MPSLGFGEIILIAVLALIIFGPNRLPEIGKSVGRGIREFRRAGSDIRAELDLDEDEEPPVVPSPGDRLRARERAEKHPTRREAAAQNGEAPAGDKPVGDEPAGDDPRA